MENKELKRKKQPSKPMLTTGKKVITKDPPKNKSSSQGLKSGSVTTKTRTQNSTKASPSKKITQKKKKQISYFERLKEEVLELWLPLKEQLTKLSTEQWYKVGYAAFSIYMGLLSLGYLKAIIWLKPTAITNNIFIILITAFAPFGLWAFSTNFDRWSFHNKKKAWLNACIISAIATLEQPIIYFSWHLFVTKIMEMPITENMTAGMIIFLARLSMVIPLIIATIIIATPVRQFITSTEMQDKIEDFKINNHVDLRKDKETKYDLGIVKNLKTGKVEPIYEHDRFVHLFINGQSGTGKTSSTIIPAVCEDLNTKLRNMAAREQALLEMLQAKEAYVAGPYTKVDETNIRPRKGFKDKYKKIKQKYPDCGMTIMAPNNDMNNTIVALCEARGIKVNVVDPAKTYKEKYALARGIANFYIPENLSEEERCIRIVEQAETFSEVLVATNESKGEGDQYFRDINTSVTTNISIACMLAANIQGQQTDINEINFCISNFNELREKIQVIEEHYGIKIDVASVDTKKSGGGMDSERFKEEFKNGSFSFQKGKGTDNPYYTTILFIKQELLGAGAEKMIDQSRGLRNLINKILLDSRYRNILSKPKEKSLDFDELLAKNEITVVNTAIEYGAPKSTALGIMFLLNFQTAVQRRPMETRSNHFIWVDEAAQYMHPVYDNMYALYRQYRVSTCLAMQSTSQMDKAKTTSYLKNIILGAGTQILFGRVSAEEMKLYQELAGEVFEDSVQKTVSQTSVFSSNASQNESERIVKERKNVLSGIKIRNRNFQEVTVFKIKNNKVQNAFLGKCSFLEKKELEDQKFRHINFAKYVPKGKVKAEPVLSKPAKKMVASQKELIETYRENIKITQIDREVPQQATPIEETKELEVTLPVTEESALKAHKERIKEEEEIWQAEQELLHKLEEEKKKEISEKEGSQMEEILDKTEKDTDTSAANEINKSQEIKESSSEQIEEKKKEEKEPPTSIFGNLFE